MKNKQTETKFKSAPGLACYLFGRVVCLGAVILICSSAAAQNLFMSDGYSGISHTLGNIYKFTPNGVRSTFASGLSYPYALAFDSAGNLFVTAWGNPGVAGYVYKYTSHGVRSTFAELGAPLGLAFDSAGNLLVMDEWSGKIYKYTPNGVRTVFATIPGPVMDQ